MDPRDSKREKWRDFSEERGEKFGKWLLVRRRSVV
jgi:hypothetical protein